MGLRQEHTGFHSISFWHPLSCVHMEATKHRQAHRRTESLYLGARYLRMAFCRAQLCSLFVFRTDRPPLGKCRSLTVQSLKHVKCLNLLMEVAKSPFCSHFWLPVQKVICPVLLVEVIWPLHYHSATVWVNIKRMLSAFKSISKYYFLYVWRAEVYYQPDIFLKVSFQPHLFL